MIRRVVAFGGKTVARNLGAIAVAVAKGSHMKYMIQVRFNGADAVIHGLPAAEQEKITAEFEAGRELPGVLDGYYIYDAPDIDAAIAFAALIPVARMGGTVEVRALMER